MDREFLKDYIQKELDERDRLLERISKGTYSFEKDRYPPDDRFVKIQKPVAYATTSYTIEHGNFWTQVPFGGSLIIRLHPWPKSSFEKILFKVSEIPKVVDFIKETGRIQMVIVGEMEAFEGLNYYDLIFQELNPPSGGMVLPSVFWGENETRKTRAAFIALARVKYRAFIEQVLHGLGLGFVKTLLEGQSWAYTILKLGRYTIAEEIENLMIDDPMKALALITVSQLFITVPFCEMRSDIYNYAFQDIKRSKWLPVVYQPKDIRFPAEIGRLLLRKLTYAPQGLRACYDLIDHYDAYDLRKVAESLNAAIVQNHPDIVHKSAEEFSEILDNVWNDPLIPRRIKNITKGIPISIGAIGTAVSAYTGDLKGFLAGLGFSVGAKFLEANIEGLSEKIAKFFARSYQANVYDFKKKYNDRIVHTKKREQN